MTIPTKDFDLESIRRRFTGLFGGFGGAARVAEPQPIITYGYASAADSTLCPFIIKPSSHQRVAIDAHRDDWM
jgi:hypothetical protein